MQFSNPQSAAVSNFDIMANVEADRTGTLAQRAGAIQTGSAVVVTVPGGIGISQCIKTEVKLEVPDSFLPDEFRDSVEEPHPYQADMVGIVKSSQTGSMMKIKEEGQEEEEDSSSQIPGSLGTGTSILQIIATLEEITDKM
jgi:hypothetical protein